MAGPGGFERFLAAASTMGVVVEPIRYPEGTHTASDAAAAIGCQVGQIVKSLVFSTPDGAVLALTSGANRVDSAVLGAAVGTTVSRADADAARAATGFSIGGTPPFGHPVPIPTYIDPDLLGHEVVWAAAGAPDAVFPIDPDLLVGITAGVVTDFGVPAG